ncbi:hypothetical protein M3Y97_00296500 [Aphelenchoides bicaudatus]|nr:hypothetical protein M3Y97_00296500 [Aphelenchoides bicaudatus]
MEQKRSTSFAGSIVGYPKAVYFILANELCERFSFYGMRAILTLYLINEFGFKESTAFFVYHFFVSLVYFSPLFGSVLADNYLNRYRVIVLGSIVYIIGLISLSIGSVNYLDMPVRSALSFVGLAVIALATGGIKPCVSSFAADQFDESRQAERSQFFSFFYFAINLGALCSMFLTPVLRGRFECFGSEYCFPLAFGVPAIFMLLATVFFLVGTRFYVIEPANKDDVVVLVFKCIVESAYAKFNNSNVTDSNINVTKKDWLDYAPAKYSYSLLAAVRSFVKVLVILLPLPLYHALADQLGSTWVVQARGMDGNVGGYFTLLPDQMNFFNSVFVLSAILIYESIIFPLVGKLCKITPLRRMSVGGLIVASSYVIAGFVQLEVNKTAAPMPSSGHSFLFRTGDSISRVWSTDGPYILGFDQNEWPSNYGALIVENGQEFNISLEQKAAYVVGFYGTVQNVRISTFRYNSTKPQNGKTRIYFSIDPKSSFIGQKIFLLNSKKEVVEKTYIKPGAFIDVLPSNFDSNVYRIAYGNNCKALRCPFQIDFVAQMGAVHLLELTDSFMEHLRRHTELKTLVQPNNVSILWQLPQFITLSFGEVLICVTVLEFCYSQAAPSMKSVLQAAWLMTSFIGNLIDMGISGTHIIKEPAAELFFYAFLMFSVMILFIYLAIQYRYVDPKEFEVTEDDNNRSRVKWTLDSVANEDRESLNGQRRIN